MLFLKVTTYKGTKHMKNRIYNKMELVMNEVNDQNPQIKPVILYFF